MITEVLCFSVLRVVRGVYRSVLYHVAQRRTLVVTTTMEEVR